MLNIRFQTLSQLWDNQWVLLLPIKLVNDYPTIFSTLLCASVNQAQAHPESSEYNQRFYSGLQQLLSKPGVLRLISWQFRKYYSDEKSAKAILRNMFEGCREDCDVLDVELGKLAPYSWFRDSYKSSIVGIAEDFSFAMDTANYSIEKVELPITFIQGTKDPMTSREVLASITRLNPSCKTTLINEAGHLTYGSHPDEFWSLANQIVSR